MPGYYRDLIGWQKALLLVKLTYQLTKKFPKEEQYCLIDQMRRAVISIPSNIAEGSGRNTNLDYARFLSIARGSCTELQTQLYIAESLGYVTMEELEEIFELSDEVIRIVTKMIQKYNQE